jgi:hypothetical protein
MGQNALLTSVGGKTQDSNCESRSPTVVSGEKEKHSSQQSQGLQGRRCSTVHVDCIIYIYVCLNSIIYGIGFDLTVDN